MRNSVAPASETATSGISVGDVGDGVVGDGVSDFGGGVVGDGVDGVGDGVVGRHFDRLGSNLAAKWAAGGVKRSRNAIGSAFN